MKLDSVACPDNFCMLIAEGVHGGSHFMGVINLLRILVWTLQEVSDVLSTNPQ